MTLAPQGTQAARLFALRDWRRFWLARLVGSAAQQMLMVALGWQMYELTGRAWDLGLVGLAQFAPSLLLVLLAGHVVDRVHRARLLAACFALQALVAAILAGLSASGAATRELILLLSALLGVLRAFQMPTQQALPAVLVPPELLARALALGAMAMQIAIIGGPALGGLLIAAGSQVVYGLCAALGVLAASLVAGIEPRQQARDTDEGLLKNLLAGFRFIAAQPIVLGAISLDLFAVLLGGATALLPIFAKDILHVGAQGLGLLRAAPAIGALLMSAVLARWTLQRHVGRWLFGGVAVYGLAMIAFGLSRHVALSWAALLVSGAADMVSVVIRQSLVQLATPDAMRGRVSAVNAIFIGASNQLGEFESGVTAEWWGPVASVVAGGAACLAIVALWMRVFPSLRLRQTLER